MASTTYEILLYYTYNPIADPTAVMFEQRKLCTRLGLKGRILIAHEGLNGTVEGTKEQTDEYVRIMLADPAFKNVDFKRSIGTGNAFPKLSIKVRDEIVSGHLGDADVDPNETTGAYIQAETLHDWIHSDKKFYIIDMRNDFEHAVGHFAGSFLPKLRNFRDLKTILPEIDHLKDETVVTVCTGGVRCEKASGFLVKHGFTNVYQLWGGIVTYMEKYPNEDFEGQLYVFDGRITMGFNQDDPKRIIVGRCEACGQPSEHFINCLDNDCHRHFICCTDCLKGEESLLCPSGCVQTRY